MCFACGPGIPARSNILWTTFWATILRTLPGHRSMEIVLKSLGIARARRRAASGEGLLKFVRNSSIKGPMEVFGSNYFEDERAKLGLSTKPKLLDYTGLWGSGEEYAYEVLNFADGKRNAQQIRDAVSAEYGPVPLDLVVEYLKLLESAGVVERVT